MNASFKTLLIVLLFVAVFAMLPWIVRFLQQYMHGFMGGKLARASNDQELSVLRIIQAVAVGSQQQKVITLEVGALQNRTWLVIGVTSTQIQLLHRMPAPQSNNLSYTEYLKKHESNSDRLNNKDDKS